MIIRELVVLEVPRTPHTINSLSTSQPPSLHRMETACAVVSCCSIPQITTESAKSASPSLDLRPNYHHETQKMVKNGDTAVQVLDKADKVGRDDVIWRRIEKLSCTALNT